MTLRGLRPEVTYALENQETGERRESAGSLLMNEGFTFELPRRAGAIWFYRPLGGG